MNETGTKMTTSEKVVAMTASPMSAVASRAASKGRIFFSSTQRNTFSRTTIASSMTMPTISTSASIVTLLSVKFSAHIMPNAETTEVGMATAGMNVERQRHQRGQDGAEHQVQVDLVEGRVDVARLVADHFQLDVGRDLGAEARQLRLHALDHRDRVLAGLAAYLHDDRRHPVEARRRPLLLGPVLGVADVAHADRYAVEGGHHEVVEGAGLGDAAHRPQRRLVEPGGHVAPGQVGILGNEGIAHVGDRDLVGGQPIGVDPDADGAGQAAHDTDLADAGRPLATWRHGLVGELGQLAERALAGERDGDHRRLVVVELRDDRRQDFARQVADGDGDLVAHVLGGHVDLAIQIERDDDDHRAGPGDRAQLLDPLDRVDLLLELLRDLGLNLLAGGARQLDPHVDGRQVDGRESVDAQPEPAGGAHDDEGHDQHRREHRALDADLGQLLHGGLGGGWDGGAADEVTRTGHHGVAALEAVDDLDILAETATGRDLDLRGPALADDQHFLDAGEDAHA